MLPTRLSFWRKKNHILFKNWAPCAYQAERLPKCFMNHEIMNIIAILLLNNNIISLDNGLHYVVVYSLQLYSQINSWIGAASRLLWCLGSQLRTLRQISRYILSVWNMSCRNNLQKQSAKGGGRKQELWLTFRLLLHLV